MGLYAGVEGWAKLDDFMCSGVYGCSARKYKKDK